METFWRTIGRWAMVLVIVAALAGGVAVAVGVLDDAEVAQGDGYATACYREQGGARWVCGSGGTLAVEAGGALEVAGDADFTGATVTGFSPNSIDSNVTVTGDMVISGTLTAVGAITGDVTGNVSGATYVTATTLYGDLVGDVTGDLTGDVTGDLTGDVTGPTTLTGLLTVTDEIQFGSNALYPLGVGLGGFQIGFGSVTMTGTVTATHATGTPYTVLCTLETWSIDTAFCVALGTTGIITATVYDLTGTEAATPVKINWLVIGTP